MVNEIANGIPGTTKSSHVEGNEHETPLWAKRITEVPTNMQAMWEYNADSTVLYAGYAPRGLAEGTDGWLIQKFTYDASKRPTVRQSAYGNWTNRASETYA